jgi:hypothetical protein
MASANAPRRQINNWIGDVKRVSAPRFKLLMKLMWLAT